MQTFKRGIKAFTGDLELRLQQFLFTYRLTPHSTTGSSPAELLIGRNPSNRLDLLTPDVERNVSASQSRQCKAFNAHSTQRIFDIGDDVWVRTFFNGESRWTLGTIIKPAGPVLF